MAPASPVRGGDEASEQGRTGSQSTVCGRDAIDSIEYIDLDERDILASLTDFDEDIGESDMDIQIPEHHVEIVTHSLCARDAIKGILHTIFFHRLFSSVRPLTRDVPTSSDHTQSLPLPAVDNVDLETMINDRSTTLLQQLNNPASRLPSSQNQEKRGQLRISFYEKRKSNNKATYTFFGRQTGGNQVEEQICWEAWVLSVRMIPPPSGTTGMQGETTLPSPTESLMEAAMKVIEIASEHKDHIPPITTAEENPFPYTIEVMGSGGRSGSYGGYEGLARAYAAGA